MRLFYISSLKVIAITLFFLLPLIVLAQKTNGSPEEKTALPASLHRSIQQNIWQDLNNTFAKFHPQEAGNSKSDSEQFRLTVEKSQRLDSPSDKKTDKEKTNANQKTIIHKRILVTGYSSTPDQCWGNPFITASGARVHHGTMACPPQYPFGTEIVIEGVGVFICEDRGGAIKGNHFDMWFASRQEALSWGKRTVQAKIKL